MHTIQVSQGYNTIFRTFRLTVFIILYRAYRHAGEESLNFGSELIVVSLGDSVPYLSRFEAVDYFKVCGVPYCFVCRAHFLSEIQQKVGGEG